MRKSAVVVFSGGLDSTVLLQWHRVQGHRILALSFDYGQRHKRELDNALSIAEFYRRDYGGRFNHRIVDLSHVGQFFRGNSQTDATVPVPEGHYEDATMKQTVVPNRNMIMLSVAGGVAVSEGAELLTFGAHGGDHAIYPDCRPDFVLAVGVALKKGNYRGPRLLAPFLHLNKSEVVATGNAMKAPLEMTWSCYNGRERHCGKCGTCVERREAFRDANVVDPTEYELP